MSSNYILQEANKRLEIEKETLTQELRKTLEELERYKRPVKIDA